MNIKPEILDAMVASGCTAEQIAAVVKASMPARSSNAERQARYRERHRNARNVTERNGDAGDVTPPSPSLPPQTPPSRPHPPVGSLREREGTDLQAEFDGEFWPRYPHKVGKPDAQRKFVAARKLARLPEIMTGLDRYIALKPADRPWCNPATWLNQARWADEPAPPLPLRVVQGQAPPPQRLKSVGQRVAERMGAIARGAEDRPPEPEYERTIDAFAARR